MIVPVNQNIWNRNIFTGHTQDALSVYVGALWVSVCAF